jgi:ppGpp synthetase/RelA/SpoT-type nucleotidyltranferase
MIAIADGKPIEIQVRTLLQHLWAQLSEKLADAVEPAVKYGGGPEGIRRLLERYSDIVKQMEELEMQPSADRTALDELSRQIRQLLESETIALSKFRFER